MNYWSQDCKVSQYQHLSLLAKTDVLFKNSWNLSALTVHYFSRTQSRRYIENSNIKDFPGGPVVKSSSSNAQGAGSIPDQGAKMPHVSWPKNKYIHK